MRHPGQNYDTHYTDLGACQYTRTVAKVAPRHFSCLIRLEDAIGNTVEVSEHVGKTYDQANGRGISWALKALGHYVA